MNLPFTPKVWHVIRLVIVFGLLALIHYIISWPHFTVNDLGFYRDLEQKVVVRGVVSREVDIRAVDQYLVLDIYQLKVAGQQVLPVNGKVLMKTQRYPEYAYGDELEIECLLKTPPVFETFSYAAYLEKDGIYVLGQQPKIKVLAHNKGNFFWAGVFGFKSFFSERVNSLFPEPEASLVAGVLLGIRKAIPEAVLDQFNTVGLTHILAISGYNVTLIITIFGWMFGSVHRKGKYLLMLGGIGLLVALTGLSASVIRAAVMGVLVLTAQQLGRKSTGLITLIASGGLMVMIQPRMLWSDLSFQLSFLSTLGLLVFMPYFEKLQLPWKVPDFIREGFLVTIAAQVFTTPLLLFVFGRFSVIAPIANIFVLPFLPFIMLFSFLALVGSFIFWPLGQLLSFVVWVLIEIVLLIVGMFASLPFAAISI